jgi:quinone-modifying oxidoreductase, subunit QmoB
MAYNEGKNDILKLDPDGELFGAVILAAGWRPDDLKGDQYPHLGYGQLPDVITNHQFEVIAAKPVRSFVPRTANRPSPWSSSRARARMNPTAISPMPVRLPAWSRSNRPNTCAKTTPTAKPSFFISTCAPRLFRILLYKGLQQDPGIFMTKGAVMGVAKNGGGMIVDAENTLLG